MTTRTKLLDFTTPGEEWALGYSSEELTRGLAEIEGSESPARSALANIELDTPANIARAVAFLKAHPPAIEDAGGDTHTYQTACTMRGLGCSKSTTLDLMLEDFNERCVPPWSPDELAVKVRNAFAYGQNEPGCDAVGNAQETFGAAIARLTERASAKTESKFRLLLPADMRKLPEPRYLIAPMIPAHSVVLWYGKFASFKSFLTQDLLNSTATGLKAFGHFPTTQGATVLCAGEAPHAIALKRWPSWAAARGVANLDNVPFAIVPRVPLVGDPAEVQELITQIKLAGLSPGIVGIDTVARALGGQDENDARSAALITGAAERIRDEFGCSVIVVHHAGKDESRGARGSSAFEGNVDAIFRVTRTPDTLAVMLQCEKMKDADEPSDIHLLGEPAVSSLVFNRVAPDEFAAATRANPALAPGVVGKALLEAGAISGEQVTTHVLAVQLCPGTGDQKTIAAMEKRLRNGSEKQLAAYAINAGGGRGSKLMWTFPAPENEGGDR